GVLKFSSEEISSNFLPYKDKKVALSIYKFLDEHHNYDDILRFHQLVYYENKWLLVLEHSENVVMHFSKRVKILPSLDTPNSKMNDDIDELKVLMDIIINYLFGSTIRDYNNFRLPVKLIAFL
ncbi:hypothetical protein Goari_016827, partial [Gossypium aridum]|nr:hypothetical protein [Gossypium aridum]